jgi:hypothetical protein
LVTAHYESAQPSKTKAISMVSPSPEEIVAFFAASDGLDRQVLRPLSHMRVNWETCWDNDRGAYRPEEDSFASDLNIVIADLAATKSPARYHDNEDALANYVIETLKWPIRKEQGRWVGADYQSILEQGGFEDLDQKELLAAAAGRVHAAIKFGQQHFDDMELSHQKMLSAILSIILYHRCEWEADSEATDQENA